MALLSKSTEPGLGAQAKCRVESVRNISLEQAQKNREAAHKELLKAMKKAPELQKKYHENLAEALVLLKDTNPRKRPTNEGERLGWTEEELAQRWRKQNSNTASEPSVLSF